MCMCPQRKKKNGKDIEVQDGWKGRIIPFELIQDAFFKNEKETINNKKLRLEEISSSYSEILDELSEEDNRRSGYVQ